MRAFPAADGEKKRTVFP